MSTTSPRRRAAPATRGLRAAAAVTAVLALLMTACGTDEGAEPGPETSPSATNSATNSATAGGSPTPSESPTSEAPVQTREAGVWFQVDTARLGLRLAREVRDLPAGDPVGAAVAAMIAGPDDPDYSSPWNPATEVLSTRQDGRRVTVDLSADARTANVGSAGAALMIQQLVYTATDAARRPRGEVELLIDGEPAGELWGAVVWDGPVRRENPDDVRLLVQIDAPREGQVIAGPLTVRGEANVFEATLVWRILDANGDVMDSSFVMTTEGFTFAPFEFGIVLDPGQYTVEIVEDDPSAGEGGPPMTDTKTVTIKAE